MIIVIIGLQGFIYFINQKTLTENFSQKCITVEFFSFFFLSNSGITIIGSLKFNKIDDDT